MEDKTTIDKFLETLSGNGIDNFDAKQAIVAIKDACSKIPVNGEYDHAIIGNRIGQYVRAIMDCGKLLASLGLVEKHQEMEVEKEFACAALERAPVRGYTTDAKAKLFAQMDIDYIKEKKKLVEIQAVIAYIENYRASLDKAQLHCKKIIDRGSTEGRISGDFEKFSVSNKDHFWVNDDDLK